MKTVTKKAVTTKAVSKEAVALEEVSLEEVSLLVEVSSKEVFLKAVQKKRLERILEKAKDNKVLTEKEIGYLKEMRRTIRCYTIFNSQSVDNKLEKLERYQTTYDHNNHI